MRPLHFGHLNPRGWQPHFGPRAGDGESRPSPLTAARDSGLHDSEEARAYRAELVQGLTPEIRDARVLEVMGRVPRHWFVPGVSLRRAYADDAASIGYGQTISQPTVVAMMTEALELDGGERVLEIGTGSGYQAAILSQLALEVYTMETVSELAEEARERLDRIGCSNVHVRAGDGYNGWPEEAPFDGIIVTAAPDEAPSSLLEQLAEGGILVAPVGPNGWTQRLLSYRKKHGHISSTDLGGVRFVPMVPGG